jgi:heme/copper-type cytochrome/quinol oxidase subunit 1
MSHNRRTAILRALVNRRTAILLAFGAPVLLWIAFATGDQPSGSLADIVNGIVSIAFFLCLLLLIVIGVVALVRRRRPAG